MQTSVIIKGRGGEVGGQLGQVQQLACGAQLGQQAGVVGGKAAGAGAGAVGADENGNQECAR